MEFFSQYQTRNNYVTELCWEYGLLVCLLDIELKSSVSDEKFIYSKPV